MYYLFNAIINEVVFLIPFSFILSIVHVLKSNWFFTLICIKQLCYTCLFILMLFKIDSLGFSVYKIMAFTSRDSFTFISFSSFSCLIALAIPSITMLSWSGESRYPCLVSHFRGKPFSLSSLSISREFSIDSFQQVEEIPFHF